MNDLRRELAPIPDEAWQEIEEEAKRTLGLYLAGRKLVDFEGPLGWQHSAVGLGRSDRLGGGPSDGVETRLRRVQPLMELRAPFELSREELDAVTRGAADPDLDPVTQAARALALAEDAAIFHGRREAGIRGISSDAEHEPVSLSSAYTQYPQAVSRATETLRTAGVDGPYAIALGPRCFSGLTQTAGAGGYPILEHVKRLLEGPLIWAPAVDGAVVLSLRGGDFLLSVGRDVSIGYLGHDAERVRLHLEESLTFRNVGPEAAVPLVYSRS